MTQSVQPRHQTDIVNGAHPGPVAYSLPSLHVRASMLPKKETKYSYNAFQMTSQKSI